MPSLGRMLSLCCRSRSDTESDTENYRVVQLGRPNPTLLRPSSAWKTISSKSTHPSLTPSLKPILKLRTFRSFDEPESTPTKLRSNTNRVIYPVQLRTRPHSLPLLIRTSEETEEEKHLSSRHHRSLKSALFRMLQSRTSVTIVVPNPWQQLPMR